jgi:hypothetical protein
VGVGWAFRSLDFETSIPTTVPTTITPLLAGLQVIVVRNPGVKFMYFSLQVLSAMSTNGGHFNE